MLLKEAINVLFDPEGGNMSTMGGVLSPNTPVAGAGGNGDACLLDLEGGTGQL